MGVTGRTAVVYESCKVRVVNNLAAGAVFCINLL